MCGKINQDNVKNFIKDFYHEDREFRDTDVVLIDNNIPNLNFKAFLKQHLDQIFFLNGNVLKKEDLERANIANASRVVIITEKNAKNDFEIDEENMMKLVAIKNDFPKARIIIEIMKQENKFFLENFPNWNPKAGDIAICIPEVKLGAIGKSCLIPGLSTLLINLLKPLSADELEDKTKELIKKKGFFTEWYHNYLRGTSNQFYIQSLSSFFADKKFTDIALFCYKRLELAMIGVIDYDSDEKGNVLIGAKSTMKVPETAKGIFIAEAQQDTLRFLSESKNQKSDLTKLANRFQKKEDEKKEKKSKKEKKENEKKNKAKNEDETSNDSTSRASSDLTETSSSKSETSVSTRSSEFQASLIISNPYDPTGSTVDEATDSSEFFYSTKPKPIEKCILPKHQKHSFNAHIIVCIFSNQDSNPLSLRNFILPLRNKNLLLEEIKPIVFIGKMNIIAKDWTSICTFPKIYILDCHEINPYDLININILQCDTCVTMASSDYQIINEKPSDKSVILFAMNVKSMKLEEEEKTENEGMVLTEKNSFKTGIPVLTEIRDDSNARFLSDEEYLDGEINLSEAFACGMAFSVSALDSLLAFSFLDPLMLDIVKIFTFYSPDSHLEKKKTYGELFVYCLENFNMICVGLYRKISQQVSATQVIGSKKRYVLCNPPSDFKLSISDYFYVIQQLE